MNSTPLVLLYTKAGCALCDEAWQELSALADELGFMVEAVDIASDPELQQRLQYLVPLVDVENGPLVTAPVTADKVLEAIALSRA